MWFIGQNPLEISEAIFGSGSRPFGIRTPPCLFQVHPADGLPLAAGVAAAWLPPAPAASPEPVVGGGRLWRLETCFVGTSARLGSGGLPCGHGVPALPGQLWTERASWNWPQGLGVRDSGPVQCS